MTRKLTREWLQHQISAIEAVGITDSNTLAAFKLALAAMDSEPVAWRWRSGPNAWWQLASRGDIDGEVEPLYRHAQPALVIPSELHPDTQKLVTDFCTALADKLYKAQLKYGYDADWKQDGWPSQCKAHFHQHIAKGDPRDVAAYCAFMWYHGWKTEAAQPAPVVPDENTLRIQGIEALEEFLTVTTPEPEMVGGIKLTMTCCRVLKTIIKNNGWADFNGGNPEEVKAETIISALREPHSDACRAAILSAAPHDTPTLNSVQSVVTVPGKWIAVSERIPETDGNYWGWWSESKRQGPVWFIKSELQAQFQSHEITHWMPLPAAPQEVKGE